MVIRDFQGQCLCKSNFLWFSVETYMPHGMQQKQLLVFFRWFFLSKPRISEFKKHLLNTLYSFYSFFFFFAAVDIFLILAEVFKYFI